MTLLLSVLAAGAYTFGGAFMKKAEGFAHGLPAAMVFVCFGTGAALQILAMRRSEVSVNYVLVLGLEAALAVLLGVAWLGEGLSARKLAGLVLILAGVMYLRLEERADAVPPGRAEAATISEPPAWGMSAPLAPSSRPAPGNPSARRRPCQNTNHAPCR